MQEIEPLTYEEYYHIYSHAVGGRDLFRKPDNYEYFLDLYDKHISPIAETYAWVLMKNHFHMLVRIKEVENIPSVITPDRVQNPVRGRHDEPKLQKLEHHPNNFQICSTHTRKPTINTTKPAAPCSNAASSENISTIWIIYGEL